MNQNETMSQGAQWPTNNTPFQIYEDEAWQSGLGDNQSSSSGNPGYRQQQDHYQPLKTFKSFNHLGPRPSQDAFTHASHNKTSSLDAEDRENEDNGTQPMDELLSKLTQHQHMLQHPARGLNSERFPGMPTDTSSVKQDWEMLRLKQQLTDAHNRIAVMDHELSGKQLEPIPSRRPWQLPGYPENHAWHQDLQNPWMTPKAAESNVFTRHNKRYGSRAGYEAESVSSGGQSGSSLSQGNDRFMQPNDSTSHESTTVWAEDPLWKGPFPNAIGARYDTSSREPPLSQVAFARGGTKMDPPSNPLANPRYPQGSNISNAERMTPSFQGNWPSSRPLQPVAGNVGSASIFNEPPVIAGHTINAGPAPIGKTLSPTAAEFDSPNLSAGPWNNQTPASDNSVFINPTEPVNYRRLLDKTVNCNWKYIVDKIVCSNDQQASIFLQQKLKIANAEQKHDIIEAITAQAYALMINRFGNFLVQRCFEHGTQDQIIAIANAIRGNTLKLSMDAFGCHVVQKAFDCVPETYKASMVHELLRRIPETVIHRYACHVWQKLFELRWNDSPPQIMNHVNDALQGMWHEVALGETGSLVVQNIFENCLEEDKRPCIDEVLNSIDVVSRGQFGNWCIQHVCEHGMPADQSRALDHVILYAVEYSMDQFASKVVEKCLKIGGLEFLDRYLNRICEGPVDRPRVPLIDIASDQFGNYLVQYILTHADHHRREMVAGHVRKHMVSLRGSKFGSKVGILCSNPASAIRPQPGFGPSMNRFSHIQNHGPPRLQTSFR